MSQWPTGTVTFLFTDVEGSTRLWETHPEETRRALVRHDALVEDVIARHDGVLVKPRGEGDSRMKPKRKRPTLLAAAPCSAVGAHQSQLPPALNKFHMGNGEDGKHYWLTPWDEPAIAQLVADYGPFDFDPCPCPKPSL